MTSTDFGVFVDVGVGVNFLAPMAAEAALSYAPGRTVHVVVAEKDVSRGKLNGRIVKKDEGPSDVTAGRKHGA